MAISLPIVLLMASHADYLLTEEQLSTWLFSLIVPGCVITAVGGRWESHLYRCPKCGVLLADGERPSQSPSRYCGSCGTKIDVIIDD